MTAFVKLVPPVARGDFKITLDAGGAQGPSAPLTEVFAEVVAQAPPGTTAPSILSFQMLHSGHVVRSEDRSLLPPFFILFSPLPISTSALWRRDAVVT